MTAEEAATLRGWVSPAAEGSAVDRGQGHRIVTSREGGAAGPAGPDGVLVLIAELCSQLEARGVRYCHWKSNESIERSLSGENELFS